MDWEDARLFLAAARAGQMLGAARRLGISQATLSRRIAALEAATGRTLLIRRPHGCAPTEAGAALVARLERIEAEMQAAEQELGGAAGRVSGTVRIGAPDGFGIAFLAPRLAVLAEAHPGLVVQLVPVPRSFSLSEREADLAVLVGRPDSGRLVARKLVDYTLGLYAAPGYLARHGTPKTVEDLSAHRLVGHVEDLVYAPGLNYPRELVPGWRSTLEVSGAIAQARAVEGGAGIGVLHDFIARQAAGLIAVLPHLATMRSYWLAMPESLRDSPRVQAVATFLRDRAHVDRDVFLRPIR